MLNAKTVKLMAASTGAGALIAMGGFAVAGTGWADPAGPASPGPVTSEEATLGSTTVDDAPPPTTPTTSSAVPPIEGPAPLPSEEEGLPG